MQSSGKRQCSVVRWVVSCEVCWCWSILQKNWANHSFTEEFKPLRSNYKRKFMFLIFTWSQVWVLWAVCGRVGWECDYMPGNHFHKSQEDTAHNKGQGKENTAKHSNPLECVACRSIGFLYDKKSHFFQTREVSDFKLWDNDERSHHIIKRNVRREESWWWWPEK